MNMVDKDAMVSMYRCTHFFSGILDFGLARSSERAFASGLTKAPSSSLSFIVVGDVSLTASICMHVVHALYVFRNAIARHAMSSATEVVGKHVGIKNELAELYHVFNTVTS